MASANSYADGFAACLQLFANMVTIDYSVEFHGYQIFYSSMVMNKEGRVLKTELRKRRGGGHDKTIRLYIDGKKKKFTLARLVCECFHGPLHGMEVNHKDRDPLNCHGDNLEQSTRSQNQKHWRKTKKISDKKELL